MLRRQLQLRPSHGVDVNLLHAAAVAAVAAVAAATAPPAPAPAASLATSHPARAASSVHADR